MLGEVCLINPRSFVNSIEDETFLSFVPMAAVEAGTGQMDSGRVGPYKEVSKGYTRFSEGDVLFAKITPCMENGKIAIAKGLTNGSGCRSTEFHVLRTLRGVAREFLMSLLLQDEFRKQAQRNMSGTAGQLRVRSAFLHEVSFPSHSSPSSTASLLKSRSSLPGWIPPCHPSKTQHLSPCTLGQSRRSPSRMQPIRSYR